MKSTEGRGSTWTDARGWVEAFRQGAQESAPATGRSQLEASSKRLAVAESVKGRTEGGKD
jgi:hypothetical protein